jgi:flagellar hook-length control protein FliK
MRTTADLIMVPPPSSTPSSDTSSPSPAPTTSSFKKTLEGARQQKSASGKAAKAASAPQKPTDSKDEVEPDETDAATEAGAEKAAVDETQSQPVVKTGKQQTATGKSASAKAGQTKLTVTKPSVAKAKTTQAADTKDDDETSEKPQDSSNSAGAQVVANAQTQQQADPVEQDAVADKNAADATAKVVAPSKTQNADAAAQSPAKPAADESATDFDSAVSAAEDILGPSDNIAQPAHAEPPDATAMTAVTAPQTAQTGATVKIQPPAPSTPTSSESQFVEANHQNIVTGIHGKLLPNGGTMTIRLDPPELGALQVSVHMREGVMTAAFETSNDQATRVLSHSLGQLKSALESAGVNVEKLHVQQSPRQESGDNSERQSNQRQDQEDQQQQARQEQQRRQMLNRMWRKLAGGEDPLDLVA